MNAIEEARSLKADPLPQIVIVDPLTRVWDIDGQIAELRKQLTELSEQREQALQYAIVNNLSEDSCCRLVTETKVRKARALNVDRFREVFPQEYEMACDIERKDIRERLEHIGEKINLTLVDKLVKKPRLEAAQGVIDVKESETLLYSVVRK